MTSLSISSGDNLPLLLVMVILLVLEVALSVAVTLRIPFSSISKDTSIYGVPLGAGGIPSKLNLPKIWLSLVRGRSPSKT